MEHVTAKDVSILVVEDDPVTSFLITLKLSQNGLINVQQVENGVDALMNLQKHCPDLILLDLNMPIMDGFEFLEEKSRQKICPEAKIIILTSSTLMADRKKAEKFPSVKAFMEKPLDNEKIEQILNCINTPAL